MGYLILYISRGHTEATYSFVSQPTLHTCKGVSISKKFLEMQIIQIKIERAKRLVWDSRDGYDIKCLLYIERQQYKHAIKHLMGFTKRVLICFTLYVFMRIKTCDSSLAVSWGIFELIRLKQCLVGSSTRIPKSN